MRSFQSSRRTHKDATTHLNVGIVILWHNANFAQNFKLLGLAELGEVLLQRVACLHSPNVRECEFTHLLRKCLEAMPLQKLDPVVVPCQHFVF